MNAGQIAVIIFLAFETGLAMAIHGTPRKSPNYNFWHSLIATGIWLVLLWWGGFWKQGG